MKLFKDYWYVIAFFKHSVIEVYWKWSIKLK